MFNSNIDKRVLPDSVIIQVGDKRKTAQLVEKFYTKNPFPGYQDFETIYDLEEKIRKNIFVENLKKFIGWKKKIIEVGSGTSQLSIALASGTNNEVIAFDPTLESLKLGAEFAEKSNIKNCAFINGDMFCDPFEKEYFDIVWCSGVLHHTENAEEGFKIIAKWLKKEGHIVIGLYNSYGRLRTVFRQKIFNVLGRGKVARSIVSFLDPVLRGGISEAKKNAWFQDQYEHPVETLHTLDEVLRWFDENGIEFVSSYPSCDSGFTDFESMFSKKSRGTKMSRIFAQISMLFSPLGGEGGLFIVIGRKPIS